MAVTFPYVRAATWADGSTTDTAAKRNTMEDGIFNAHQQPAVRAYNSTGISIANNTLTVLTLDSERFDVAGGASSTQHSTSSNTSRLTALYAGKYQITGYVDWTANGTGVRQLHIRLNGAAAPAWNSMNASSAGESYMTITTLWDMAVNDYVELLGLQTSGGNLNVIPEFMMVRVA